MKSTGRIEAIAICMVVLASASSALTNSAPPDLTGQATPSFDPYKTAPPPLFGTQTANPASQPRAVPAAPLAATSKAFFDKPLKVMMPGDLPVFVDPAP